MSRTTRFSFFVLAILLLIGACAPEAGTPQGESGPDKNVEVINIRSETFTSPKGDEINLFMWAHLPFPQRGKPSLKVEIPGSCPEVELEIRADGELVRTGQGEIVKRGVYQYTTCEGKKRDFAVLIDPNADVLFTPKWVEIYIGHEY